MKKCSQCGTVVPDSSQVGGRCPRCGLTWQAERTTSYSYTKQKRSWGCSWITILLIICIGSALVVPKVFSDKRDSAIVKEISSQWLMLNVDSLVYSAKTIMSLDSAKRIKVFYKVSVIYAGKIDEAKGEQKIQLINYVGVIDSVYKNADNSFAIDGSRYTSQYSDFLHTKLVILQTDSDLSTEIRRNAEFTLNKIHGRATNDTIYKTK